jgi:N-acetylneuraminate lyase
MKHYVGLIPAAYTPCRANGDLHLDPIPAMAALFAKQAMPAVFICGSTGEGHSFTVAERMQTAEAWRRSAPATLDVIVHVGHNCQRDSIALASHARECGAAAVATMAPSYFKPATVGDVVGFVRPIAAAAGDLPFYYYDIPSMTGVSFRGDLVLREAARAIPNFAGLKYTTPDLMRLQSCLAYDGGKYDILYGSDEIHLAALAFGVRGAVGSTYNYAAPVYQRVREAFARNDLETARAEQRKSVELVEILFEHGVMRAGKAIMSLLGIDCGPIRPPLKTVERDELKAIYEKLRGLDVFPAALRMP